MAHKFVYVIVSALLVASSTMAPAAHSRGAGGGGGHFTMPAGVHQGGYAIGTQSSGQYANSLAGRTPAAGGYAIGTQSSGQYHTNLMNAKYGGLGRGNWRRNGYGNYGYGYGYGLGGVGVDNGIDSSSTLTPAYVPDGAAPATPHRDGPAMAFPDDNQSAASGGNPFGWTGGLAGVPASGPAVASEGNFAPPRIKRGITASLSTSASLGNGAPPASAAAAEAAASKNLTGDVAAKLESVQDTLNQFKASGQLGSFDVDTFNSRLDGIKDQLKALQSSSPTAQADGAGSLMNDLNCLEFDIKNRGN